MKQTSLRYPADKVDPRVDRLIPHMQEAIEEHTVTAAKVKARALLLGLDELERIYLPKAKS